MEPHLWPQETWWNPIVAPGCLVEPHLCPQETWWNPIVALGSWGIKGFGLGFWVFGIWGDLGGLGIWRIGGIWEGFWMDFGKDFRIWEGF